MPAMGEWGAANAGVRDPATLRPWCPKSTCRPLHAPLQLHTFRYDDISVRVQEGSLGDGVGAKVWVVAHIMCRRLSRDASLVRGRRVLEIGAGCGVCGIVAAQQGAAAVVLTDNVPAVLDNLRACIHLNGAADEKRWDDGAMHVRHLDWEESLHPGSAANANACTPSRHGDGAPKVAMDDTFDVILGTDVLYEPDMASLVAAVLTHRLRPGGEAHICCAVRDQVRQGQPRARV